MARGAKYDDIIATFPAKVVRAQRGRLGYAKWRLACWLVRKADAVRAYTLVPHDDEFSFVPSYEEYFYAANKGSDERVAA